MTTTFALRGAAFAGLALALALMACGGDGDVASTTAAANTTVAAAADNSTLESFLAYQRTLAAPETIDPETLQKQLAPIDDTAEPIRLN